MLDYLVFAGYSAIEQPIYFYTKEVSCVIDKEELKHTPIGWFVEQCQEKDSLTVVSLNFLNEADYYRMLGTLNISELADTLSSRLGAELKDFVTVIHNGTRADDFYFSCWDGECYETLVPARLHLHQDRQANQ